MNIPSSAMLRVLKAREKVGIVPYLSSAIYSAKLIQSDKGRTMWTDGVNVFYNPKFVDKYQEFTEGVLLHEALHCMLLHVSRKEWRDLRLFNQACDYAINPIVKRYFALPAMALDDVRFHNMSAEKIYSILADEKEKNKGKTKPQSDSPGDEGDGDESQAGDIEEAGEEGDKSESGDIWKDGSDPMQEASSEELEEAKNKWRRALSQAKDKQSTQPGNVPGDLERLINELAPKAVLNWRDILYDIARDATTKTQRSWSRVNRKYFGSGIYLPGYDKDAITRMVFAFDVSGSVSADQHKEMREQVAELLENRMVTHAVLLAVDTEIKGAPYEATSVADVQAWKPKGGGGTDFNSAMKYIATMSDCIGCVFLTDMETNSFGAAPPFPMIWVSWRPQNNIKGPFGQTFDYYAK